MGLIASVGAHRRTTAVIDPVAKVTWSDVVASEECSGGGNRLRVQRRARPQTHEGVRSYRRSDDANFIGRFHDRLTASFGEDNVFRDLDSLHGGSDFAEVIQRELGTIDVVVAMIGPTWATRLAEPGDFVHMELIEALRVRRPIVPILIEAMAIPERDELPPDIQPLLRLNALPVRRDPDFRRDASRAIESIRVEGTAFRMRQEQNAEHEVELEAARVAKLEQEAAFRREADEAERKRARQIELEGAEREAAEQRARAERLAREVQAARDELRRLEDEDRLRRLTAERARLDALQEQQESAERQAREAATRANSARASDLEITQADPPTDPDASPLSTGQPDRPASDNQDFQPRSRGIDVSASHPWSGAQSMIAQGVKVILSIGAGSAAILLCNNFVERYWSFACVPYEDHCNYLSPRNTAYGPIAVVLLVVLVGALTAGVILTNPLHLRIPKAGPSWIIVVTAVIALSIVMSVIGVRLMRLFGGYEARGFLANVPQTTAAFAGAGGAAVGVTLLVRRGSWPLTMLAWCAGLAMLLVTYGAYAWAGHAAAEQMTYTKPGDWHWGRYPHGSSSIAIAWTVFVVVTLLLVFVRDRVSIVAKSRDASSQGVTRSGS